MVREMVRIRARTRVMARVRVRVFLAFWYIN